MEFVQEFIELANTSKLTVIVALIAANFVLGIATSLYTKTFRLGAVADFLRTRIVPYVLGYFVVVVVAVTNPAFHNAITIVWGILIATLAGKILANLKNAGVNLPNVLAGDK